MQIALNIAYQTERGNHQEKKGDLMARMNSDVGEIENAVISMMELVFREPISILIHVITLIYISPSLTLFSFFVHSLSRYIWQICQMCTILQYLYVVHARVVDPTGRHELELKKK